MVIETVKSQHTNSLGLEYSYSLRHGDTKQLYQLGCSLAKLLAKQQLVILGHSGTVINHIQLEAFEQGLRHAGIHIINVQRTILPTLLYNTKPLAASSAILLASTLEPNKIDITVVIANQILSQKRVQAVFDRTVSELASPVSTLKPANPQQQIGISINLDYINSYYAMIAGQLASTKNAGKVLWDLSTCPQLYELENFPKFMAGLFPELAATLANASVSLPPSQGSDLTQQLATMRDRLAAANNDSPAGIIIPDSGQQCLLLDDQGELVASDEVLLLLLLASTGRSRRQVVIADNQIHYSIAQKIMKSNHQLLLAPRQLAQFWQVFTHNQANLGGLADFRFLDTQLGHFCPDGLFTAFQIIDAVAKLKQPLSEWRKPFSTLIRQNLALTTGNQAINKLIKYLQSKKIAYTQLDGIRIASSHGTWILLTGPTANQFQITLQSDNPENYARLKTSALQHLGNVGISLA